MIKGKNKLKTSIVVGKLSDVSDNRTFIDGSTRSHVTLKTAVIGLGTYKPGWRWSLHAGPQLGQPSENHIGYVISGQLMVRDPEGVEAKIVPGEAFEISAGSDAWVVGDAPCVAIDFTPFAVKAKPAPSAAGGA